MPLRYVLDENQRGVLWQAIQRHNARGLYLLDAVRVGDVADLPLGADDQTILRWAEREERILVTFDTSTIPTHLGNYLAGGGHSPGVFIPLRESQPLAVVEFLAVAAWGSDPEDWRDSFRYIP